MFELDPRLQEDTIAVGDLPLCTLLLSRDANYPWLILVPRVKGITEIHQLSAADQQTLIRESSLVAREMEALFKPKSMNVAALGNIVSQLHIHHVARFEDDLAWPGPIWGAAPSQAYTDEKLKERVEMIAARLAGYL